MLYSLRPWLLTYDRPLCTTSSNLFSFQQSDARVTRFQGGGMVEAPIYSDDHKAGEALPLPVRFSSSSSSEPDIQPLTYSWIAGDGGTSIATTPYTCSHNRDHVAITVGNSAPVARSTYSIEDVVLFNEETGTHNEAGTITDAYLTSELPLHLP